MSQSASADPASLAGQVALVTGASGGIGRAIALALARRGADVLLHAHSNPRRANETAAEIERQGRAAQAIQADIGEESDVARLAHNAWSWRDGLDVLVCAAGADVLTGEAAAWSFEQRLSALWRVDVLGTMRLARELGARMQERGRGVVLTIGWDQAEQGMAGDSGQMFGAVKGAVMAFSKSLAQSLAPRVRVNCLAPGWIRTAWGESASDYWQARATRQALRERWGTPDDVAQAAAFYASPAADFLTGQIVSINGGFRYE